MKPKVTWIKMEDLTPPRKWALPFTARWQGQKYQITGADYVTRCWRAEEMS